MGGSWIIPTPAAPLTLAPWWTVLCHKEGTEIMFSGWEYCINHAQLRKTVVLCRHGLSNVWMKFIFSTAKKHSVEALLHHPALKAPQVSISPDDLPKGSMCVNQPRKLLLWRHNNWFRGPQNHKTITEYLFLFVSYDNRGFNKAAGGENKTPHMGPDVTLEQHLASVCYAELNT